MAGTATLPSSLDSISKEFHSMHSAIKTHAIEMLDQVKMYDTVQPSLDHKMFLDIIKADYNKNIA